MKNSITKLTMLVVLITSSFGQHELNQDSQDDSASFESPWEWSESLREWLWSNKTEEYANITGKYEQIENISTVIEPSSDEANGTTLTQEPLDTNMNNHETKDLETEVQIVSSVQLKWLIHKQLMQIVWPHDKIDFLVLTSLANPDSNCTFNAKLLKDDQAGKINFCRGSEATILQIKSTEFGTQELVLLGDGTILESKEVNLKPQNSKPWTGQCMQCQSNDGCEDKEIGTSTQCVDGTVACISGTGDLGKRKRHCGPLDELPVYLNDCEQTNGGTVCTCDYDNCNLDPEETIEEKIESNTEEISRLSQDCITSAESTADQVNQLAGKVDILQEEVQELRIFKEQHKNVLSLIDALKAEVQELTSLKQHIENIFNSQSDFNSADATSAQLQQE